MVSEYYRDYQYGPDFWLGTLYHEKGELARAYENTSNALTKRREVACFVDEDSKYKQFFKTYKTTGL